METLPALQQKAVSLRDYLNKENIKGALASALPKWMSIDRLLRIVFTSTMKNPKLLDCTMESLLQSVMQCAQLGLEPILGRAYLIPYKNKKLINGKWEKVLECQFQPGYQGLVDLGRRSGQVKDVFAMVVYENDEFDLEYGTNRHLTHKPCLTEDPGKAIGAYTVWELSDGTKTFEFMPLHELYKRRAKSQAYQYAVANPKNDKAQECPWVQWPEEQMKKTVVKHHSKLQPASIEYMQAVELDNAADLGRSQIGMFSQSPTYDALAAPSEAQTLTEKMKNGKEGAAEELYGKKDEDSGKAPETGTEDYTDLAFTEEFRLLRKSGLQDYATKNIIRLIKASSNVQEAWADKWEKVMGTKWNWEDKKPEEKAPLPDPEDAPVGAEPKPKDGHALPKPKNGYIFCPTDSGGTYAGKQVSFAAVCGACSKKDQCDLYQIYLDAQRGGTEA